MQLNYLFCKLRHETNDQKVGKVCAYEGCSVFPYINRYKKMIIFYNEHRKRNVKYFFCMMMDKNNKSHLQCMQAYEE